MVSISQSNNTMRITVRNADSSNYIQANDYSAKYYSDLAKTSAELAQNIIDSALDDITAAKESAIEQIETMSEIEDGILTIQKNGVTVNTFTANSSSNVTANITVPTNNNELTNGAGYISSIKTINNNSLSGTGNIDVGTVTSVNNIQPVNGNVTLTLPDPLPSQTGNAGKYLTTDGTDASWGDLTTVLNGKADIDLSNVLTSKGILTESYVNGASWYRVYSDGWCEQGGYSSSAVTTVNLLKSFTDTNYTITTTNISSSSGGSYAVNIQKSTTSFTTEGTQPFGWQACGYIS